MYNNFLQWFLPTMHCEEESIGKLEEPYGRHQTCKSDGGCFQGKKVSMVL